MRIGDDVFLNRNELVELFRKDSCTGKDIPLATSPSCILGIDDEDILPCSTLYFVAQESDASPPQSTGENTKPIIAIKSAINNI